MRGCNEWNDKFEQWRADVSKSVEAALASARQKVSVLLANMRGTADREVLDVSCVQVYKWANGLLDIQSVLSGASAPESKTQG